MQNFWYPVKSTALGPLGRLRRVSEQEGAKDHRRGCKPPVKSHTV